jgi:zinc finger protein
MAAKKAKEDPQKEEGGPAVLGGQKCPMCFKDSLTLMEAERDVPFFGQVAIFSMDCNGCNYHKADVEALEKHDPVKFTLTVENEEDLKVRVVKSSHAKVKVPRIMSIDPGPASNGYVTNVEGLLNRVKVALEKVRDTEDDKAKRKKAKNMLKKVQAVLWGHDSIDVIIEDPSGNSAILSEKVKKEKLKKK